MGGEGCPRWLTRSQHILLNMPAPGPDSNYRKDKPLAPDYTRQNRVSERLSELLQTTQQGSGTHRKSGQLGTPKCWSTHTLFFSFLPSRLGSDSPGGLECPYLHPGNHFLSGPAPKEREHNAEGSTHPPCPGVSRGPSPPVPTGPEAPVCAAFRTPGRSVGTRRQSAPAPAGGG